MVVFTAPHPSLSLKIRSKISKLQPPTLSQWIKDQVIQLTSDPFIHCLFVHNSLGKIKTVSRICLQTVLAVCGEPWLLQEMRLDPDIGPFQILVCRCLMSSKWYELPCLCEMWMCSARPKTKNHTTVLSFKSIGNGRRVVLSSLLRLWRWRWKSESVLHVPLRCITCYLHWLLSIWVSNHYTPSHLAMWPNFGA